MLFSHKKKLQRDRDAGLVFTWRGSLGGNRGGLLMAFLMTLGLFGMAFWVVSLDLPSARPESRQAAKILLLENVSPEMALWIDQHSPFPSRWDPQFDEGHQLRVDDALERVYQEVSVPRSPWREMPVVAGGGVTSPRLIVDGEVDLGALPMVDSVKAKPMVLELDVKLQGVGSIKERIPQELLSFDMVIPRQAYGMTRRFALSLREDGSVLTCTPVNWEVSEFDRELENWVRMQSYQAVEDGAGVELGEVSVNVEVKAHVGN
ncbi:hypothetical protein ACFPK9_00760 [Rubritalea spongiae]|uniref:Uncharacterized protein n=1 Tax=Rubritalea spongiae TaxID=430797 RepID=A0ABW5E5J8_9BACT